MFFSLLLLPIQVSLKDFQPNSKKNIPLAQQITKSKPKPNLLEKPTAKQQQQQTSQSQQSHSSTGSTTENTPSPPSSPYPNSAVTAAVNQRIDELVSELQKMKAIILKHEVRIRELERKTTIDNVVTGSSGSPEEANNNNGDSNLLPDEV